MKIRKLLTGIFAASLLLTTACNDDNEDEIIVEKGAYESGIFIANEGGINKNQAEVSYITPDLANVSENIYAANNANQPLGDILQSVGLNDDKAYLVVNNSNKIEVVDRYNFKKATTISSNINQPRYIAFANNYIYVTNDAYGGEKYVSIYKNGDYSFVKKISFTDAAERVVAAGSKVYVQNSSYGYGNKISVINSSNDLETAITLPKGDINKTIAYNNKVYTIASDGVDSYVYSIDGGSTSISKTLPLTGLANATNLEIANDIIYFSSGNKVYTMPLSSTSVPSQPLFTVAENPYSMLYGFSVIDGKIFTADAKGFTAGSEVTIYSLTGNKLKTFTSGVGVNAFYKN